MHVIAVIGYDRFIWPISSRDLSSQLLEQRPRKIVGLLSITKGPVINMA